MRRAWDNLTPSSARFPNPKPYPLNHSKGVPLCRASVNNLCGMFVSNVGAFREGERIRKHLPAPHGALVNTQHVRCPTTTNLPRHASTCADGVSRGLAGRERRKRGGGLVFQSARVSTREGLGEGGEGGARRRQWQQARQPGRALRGARAGRACEPDASCFQSLQCRGTPSACLRQDAVRRLHHHSRLSLSFFPCTTTPGSISGTTTAPSVERVQGGIRVVFQGSWAACRLLLPSTFREVPGLLTMALQRVETTCEAADNFQGVLDHFVLPRSWHPSCTALHGVRLRVYDLG